MTNVRSARCGVRGAVRGAVLTGLVVAFALCGVPTEARAQGMIAAHVGTTTGGDTSHSATAVGVTGGWTFTKWLGAEADLGWAPEFFKQNGFLTRRSVVTFMGNGVVQMPGRHALVPYASGGVGLFKPRLSEPGDVFAVDANKWGWNAGGGATMFHNDIGVRMDVRYFQGARKSAADANPFDLDFSKFGFWRASAGLAVRF